MKAASNPNNPNLLKLVVAAEIAGKELTLDDKTEPKREFFLT